VVDLTGTAADETLNGSSGDDLLDGGAGAGSILGGAGNDTLLGGSAEVGDYNALPFDDTLAGGAGDDVLRGGAGNDVYVFNIGDGQDTISDEYVFHGQLPLGDTVAPETLDGGLDTLKFGPGIGPDDVILTVIGEDLYIGIAESNTGILDLSDLVKVEKWQDSLYRVERIAFDDGTVWSEADVRALDRYRRRRSDRLARRRCGHHRRAWRR
jgi:Ca2+-binding RTX toxin-like protein